MKRFLVAMLCLIVPLAMFAADNAYRVTYDGGSLPDIKAGTGMKLYIEGNQVRFVNGKKELVTVPASAISEISYGQDVHRRVGTARLPLASFHSASAH